MILWFYDLSCNSLSILKSFSEASSIILFSRLSNTNSLSLSWQHKCSTPLIMFVALLLTCLQQIHIFSLLRALELSTVPQIEIHKNRREEHNPLPQHAAFVQPRMQFAFWGGSAYFQLILSLSPTCIHRFFSTGLLSVSSPHSLYQNHQLPLSLGLFEFHHVNMDPVLDLVQVPLEGVTSFRDLKLTAQLDVLCKFTDVAVDPAVYGINQVPVQTHDKHHLPVFFIWTLSCWSLPLGCDHPTNILSTEQSTIKFKSVQFGDKDTVGNPVKGLTDCQMDDTSIPFLVHRCSQSIKEGHQIGEARFALGESSPCLPLPQHRF